MPEGALVDEATKGELMMEAYRDGLGGGNYEAPLHLRSFCVPLAQRLPVARDRMLRKAAKVRANTNNARLRPRACPTTGH